ncbi:MAG: TIM barrel protein [Candidatus Hydrogenedentes bacterium]|nr:TIM barrel protein [Candidatus Hydrogenedentota bacterium]
MDFGICSFSYHRLLAAGKQDIFKYIEDCKKVHATQLDPWNAHLAPVKDGDAVLKAGADPENAQLSPQDEDYLKRVKVAADYVGLPFGCIAVDGAHIYEPTEEARRGNRALAYRWLDVGERLGARQVRIDAGGPAEMPDDIFAIIVEGYNDLVARGRERGIEILMENHWGPSQIPENVVKILEAVDGLGLLFDTNNWAPGMQERGWELCAKYAKASHIKTFEFDENGDEPSVDIPRVMNLLLDEGYDESWGIESCPTDGDEYAGVEKTISLMKRVLAEYAE